MCLIWHTNHTHDLTLMVRFDYCSELIDRCQALGGFFLQVGSFDFPPAKLNFNLLEIWYRGAELVIANFLCSWLSFEEVDKHWKCKTFFFSKKEMKESRNHKKISHGGWRTEAYISCAEMHYAFELLSNSTGLEPMYTSDRVSFMCLSSK